MQYNQQPSRRKHPRYSSQINAIAYSDPDQTQQVTVADISYEGLRIEATSAIIEALTQDCSEHSRISVAFDVPLDGTLHPVQLLCSVIHRSEVNGDQLALGLELHDIETGVMVLSDYINQLGTA